MTTKTSEEGKKVRVLEFWHESRHGVTKIWMSLSWMSRVKRAIGHLAGKPELAVNGMAFQNVEYATLNEEIYNASQEAPKVDWYN